MPHIQFTRFEDGRAFINLGQVVEIEYVPNDEGIMTPDGGAGFMVHYTSGKTTWIGGKAADAMRGYLAFAFVYKNE